MRGIFKVLIASAAILVAVASCNKSEVDTIPSNKGLVHFSLNANSIETRTAIMDMGSGAWQPIWQSTDSLGVLTSLHSVETNSPLSADGIFIAQPSVDGRTAVFEGSLNLGNIEEKTLYCILPAKSITQTYKAGDIGIDVPFVQTPAAINNDTYAIAGDILLSKPVSYSIVNNEATANEDLYFKRLTGVVKLNLKFPNTAVCSNDAILSVSMNAAKANLTGRIRVLLETGEITQVVQRGSNNASRTVTANISSLGVKATGTTPVFFSVAPVEMKASDGNIVFTIETENYTIVKTVTGKDLSFMSGEIRTIGLDLTAGASCVYTDKGGAENPDTPEDSHEVTPGRYTIDLSKDLFGVSSGSNGDEQSVWSESGLKIVSGCTSSAQNKTYYDASHIRFYTDSYLKLSVPSGYEIIKVVLYPDGTWNGDGISTGGSGVYSDPNKTWEGRNTSVEFLFSKQCRIASIKVSIVKAGASLPAEQLVMSPITCSSISASSLVFTWDKVAGAIGYQVKIDDGEFSAVQTENSFTCSDLGPEQEVTIYVKAVGDNVEYAVSEAASCSGTTSALSSAVTPFSWSVDGATQKYTDGFALSSNLKAAGSGYRQDNSTSQEYYITLYNKMSPIFTSNPGTVSVNTVIGGGTGNKDLSGDIYVCLVDKDGNPIEGTVKSITSKITTAAGDSYTVSVTVPSSVTTAYGIKIYHQKTASYNCRFYSVSVQ